MGRPLDERAPDFGVPEGILVEWTPVGLTCRLGNGRWTPAKPGAVFTGAVVTLLNLNVAAAFVLAGTLLGGSIFDVLKSVGSYALVGFLPMLGGSTIAVDLILRRYFGPSGTQLDLSPTKLSIQGLHRLAERIEIPMHGVERAEAIWPGRPGEIVIHQRDGTQIEVPVYGSRADQLAWVADRINDLVRVDGPDAGGEALRQLKSVVAQAQ